MGGFTGRVESAKLPRPQAVLDSSISRSSFFVALVLAVCWAGPANFDDENEIYTSFGFRGETRSNREDFCKTFNISRERGGVMVGRQVHITLNLGVDLLSAPKPF